MSTFTDSLNADNISGLWDVFYAPIPLSILSPLCKCFPTSLKTRDSLITPPSELTSFWVDHTCLSHCTLPEMHEGHLLSTYHWKHESEYLRMYVQMLELVNSYPGVIFSSQMTKSPRGSPLSPFLMVK